MEGEGGGGQGNVETGLGETWGGTVEEGTGEEGTGEMQGNDTVGSSFSGAALRVVDFPPCGPVWCDSSGVGRIIACKWVGVNGAGGRHLTDPLEAARVASQRCPILPSKIARPAPALLWQ